MSSIYKHTREQGDKQTNCNRIFKYLFVSELEILRMPYGAKSNVMSQDTMAKVIETHHPTWTLPDCSPFSIMCALPLHYFRILQTMNGFSDHMLSVFSHFRCLRAYVWGYLNCKKKPSISQ